eukprot:1194474-Prorocentrum_minimum.AAC.2
MCRSVIRWLDKVLTVNSTVSSVSALPVGCARLLALRRARPSAAGGDPATLSLIPSPGTTERNQRFPVREGHSHDLAGSRGGLEGVLRGFRGGLEGVHTRFGAFKRARADPRRRKKDEFTKFTEFTEITEKRRGPWWGWSTGHEAPRWAAGGTGLPRCVRIYPAQRGAGGGRGGLDNSNRPLEP